MPKGYVIIVRDYVAEICEFTTLSIEELPDGSRLYYVHTKYGDDYYKEDELSPIRKALEEEYNQICSSLMGVHSEGSIHKTRR